MGLTGLLGPLLIGTCTFLTEVWLLFFLLLLMLMLMLCADTMEFELSPILMQDTVGFVMKLKRLVIYECERSALQKRFS